MKNTQKNNSDKSLMNKHFKLFALLFCFLILFSCTEKLKKVTKESFPDGKPKLEQFFSTDGKETLIKEIEYHPNHKKKMEGRFNNQQRDGLWTAWYEDGKKWSEGYFKIGLSDSIRTVWHPNGKKYYQGYYKEEKKVGVWKFWDENEKLVKEVDFDKLPKDSLSLK